MAQPQLKQIITETLSPHAEVRKRAEAGLVVAQKTPGHALQVLELVASSNASEAAVRQASAVHFKNLVKKGWEEGSDSAADAGIVLPPEHRKTIKTHLVQLMCTTPPQIQVQLSESISLIAKTDYHEQWQDLLPQLVQQMQSPDMTVVLGVLKTANSIFKSFRYVQRSDDLYKKILYTLAGIQAPLLAFFTQTGLAAQHHAGNKAELVPRLQALRLAARIFYSLNFQDLPEFFEDHMQQWMEEFAKYLHVGAMDTILVDADEEREPTAMDELRAAIIQNLALYADKDEEEFVSRFLPSCATAVWNLLLTLTPLPKHDPLATTSIKFLSSLVKKQMHRALFQQEDTLRQIVSNIVIPNLTFREADEERFEDDPREYMVTEVEGSDSESRRWCSQDLLRSMCRQFEETTTTICATHVTTMLQAYAQDPNGQWAAKDAAIHLMMGIAIRRESAFGGVTETNSAVNVLDFFQKQILPELQDTNHASRPVVKATCIKFVATFRNQFSRDNLIQLFPVLIAHLSSPIVVVHTFAAYTMERILITKTALKQPTLGSAGLQPFLESLFTGLFSIVEKTDLNENDYVMKCVMRSLATAGQDIVPVTQTVLVRLSATLVRVAKNPRNPQFNHYLFESIAVLVKSVCSQNAQATSSLEPLLFEPFNIILQQDVAEFTPYVFQILAQLLEYRPAGSGLGAAYSQLFPPLMTPTLWTNTGNVPGLTRLIQAYVQQGAAELQDKLMPILGIFQSLLSKKSTEAQAFQLLHSVVTYFPQESLNPTMGTVFQLVLHRLQHGPSVKYKGLVTHFFALFAGKFGSQAFVAHLDAMQNGLVKMLLVQVWAPYLQTFLRDKSLPRIEAKTQAIGLTRVLFDNPFLLEDAAGQQAFGKAVAALVQLLTSPVFQETGRVEATDTDDATADLSYDAAFSQLNFCKKPADDPFASAADPVSTFVQHLGKLSSQQPGRLGPLLQQAMGDDPKLQTSLQTMMSTHNVRLA